MKHALFAAFMALSLFLPAGAANESATSLPTSPTSLSFTGHEGGDVSGTVVVWNHYTSGKPTAHLQGMLYDRDGRRFAAVVARLEDWGGVTGYAVSRCGLTALDGEWCFDRRHDEGRFELEFDFGDTRQVEFEGCFEGRHARWATEWEFSHRH